MPFTEQRRIAGPPHLLAKTQAGAVELDDFGTDPQLVVQPRRRQVARLGRMHDEQQVLYRQLRLGTTQYTQPFGASPLHELEVIDVIDDAARVGVFIIDPTGMGERLSLVLRAHTLVSAPPVANGRGNYFFRQSSAPDRPASLIWLRRPGTLRPKCR
ncbi:hypothetical protein D3C78_1421810 [compost metagenome]